MNKNNIIIASILFMIAIFASAAYLYNSNQVSTQKLIAKQNTSAFIAAHSPRKGHPDAKVTIVEFFDPACHTCKQFHPVIKDLLQKHPTKINVVMRYSPFHQGSDQMVAILEGARKQNKYWDVLEMMFDTQEKWAINHVARADLFWSYLQTTNAVDIERMVKDLNDPAIGQAIQQDITDGQTLGANKTPTFFVNGKPLPSFGYDQLMDLVNSELAANY